MHLYISIVKYLKLPKCRQQKFFGSCTPYTCCTLYLSPLYLYPVYMWPLDFSDPSLVFSNWLFMRCMCLTRVGGLKGQFVLCRLIACLRSSRFKLTVLCTKCMLGTPIPCFQFFFLYLHLLLLFHNHITITIQRQRRRRITIQYKDKGGGPCFQFCYSLPTL